MKGWKTLLAGLLSIGYGVGGYALGAHDAGKMIELATVGLGMIGLGHKLDRNGE